MPGESSELEVLSEKLYTEYSKKLPSTGGGKGPLGRAGTLRLHLKKAEKGWTQASQSGTGPGVGNPNRYPKKMSSPSKLGKSDQPSHSPLTNELLEPGEELLRELDYEDVEEINQQLDPEIAQAVANIPQADIYADVEMQDIRPPPGFEPEVAKAGYDVNLVMVNRAHLPRLWQEKTGCWMLRKASPKHQEMASWVTIPTTPLTAELQGHYLGPVSPRNQTTIS